MAAIIAGAGEATGLALARKFAAQGLAVHGARRRPPAADAPSSSSALSGVSMHAVDFRSCQQVEEFVEHVEATSGPIRLAVHNIGANVHFPVADTTERVYRKTWELAALSAFHFAKALGPRMAARGEGTLLFTGTTASLRGGAGFCAFSGAMAAKRMLAQSLARELGPRGVHVAHCVIDGPIDTPFVEAIVGAEAFARLRAAGGLLAPADIAETYWALHAQPASAWTHELDLRPHCERF